MTQAETITHEALAILKAQPTVGGGLFTCEGCSREKLGARSGFSSVGTLYLYCPDCWQVLLRRAEKLIEKSSTEIPAERSSHDTRRV